MAADTIAQLMDQVSAVVTILPADAEVKEVYLGDGGICSNLRAGQIAIEMTTCQPQTVLDLQERFRGKAPILSMLPSAAVRRVPKRGPLVS